MLPFGSITSIIPLFILGFVYFIYFSTAFFVRYVPQESNETDFNKTIAVSDSGYSKEYPDFRDTNLHEIDAVTPEEFDFSLYRLSSPVTHASVRGKPVQLHIVSSFSPRPPPIC